MALYIKFDSKEEENLTVERFNSFAHFFNICKDNFKLTNAKFVLFKELPLKEYNENLFYDTTDHLSDAISGFQKTYHEKSKYGLEIVSDFNVVEDSGKISFILLPEKDTKKELPDLMIELVNTRHFDTIDHFLVQTQNRQAIMRIVNNFQEMPKNGMLKIKRLKVTTDNEAVSPVGTLVYYAHPKEYIIDNVRLAKKTSLKKQFDLANEAKIGTIVHNNKLANERLHKLMKKANIQRESGSIWLFSQDEEKSRELYEMFEKEVLEPIAKTFPSRSRVTNAIAQQTEFRKK